MKVWKYGDSINTDMLFPGKYCYTASTIEEIKPHLLEDLDPTFAKEAKEGDIIFAGRNFGCGSSREQPVLGLKAFGIKAVVAESFARIFYRAAINQGLVLIENPEAVKAFTGEEEVSLDLESGELAVGDKKFTFPPLPPEIKAIAQAGGLLEYTKMKLRGQKG
ncbi:MAG: 3-isopropylmalate dehydratase [Thermoplasmata archaeon]|nr:MAG: 3-isopropylmalate dehydratase [Thermoplasmata archaeon]